MKKDLQLKTWVSFEPKIPNLTFPTFYLFPRQGGKPPVPPYIGNSCKFIEHRRWNLWLWVLWTLSCEMQRISLSFCSIYEAAVAVPLTFVIIFLMLYKMVVSIFLYLHTLLSITLTKKNFILHNILLWTINIIMKVQSTTKWWISSLYQKLNEKMSSYESIHISFTSINESHSS